MKYNFECKHKRKNSDVLSKKSATNWRLKQTLKGYVTIEDDDHPHVGISVMTPILASDRFPTKHKLNQKLVNELSECTDNTQTVQAKTSQFKSDQLIVGYLSEEVLRGTIADQFLRVLEYPPKSNWTWANREVRRSLGLGRNTDA